MQQILITTGMFAGGLGLFLLAVNMITDGLKLAAGHALRTMLGKWTRSPVHGIAAGLSITAIVQSSSAVTVATIGFVNAGLIALYQALGVIYGANIGTTMTGWLVAVVGFKVNVELFALPMIGVGMLLHLTGKETRRAPIGQALAGFGLFFIGVDVLRDAFAGSVASLEMEKFILGEGILDVMMYLGVGFMLTVLTQSSSAAIAIILTAVTGGMLGLYAAAAMIIGANVGTTSTAGFAVIGATPNAKRVAAAHVIFNVATGIVALIILPVLFWLVSATGEIIGLEDIPAITLALFHTTFNVLGVLLILPFSSRLVRLLEKWFVTQEESEARPRYLDNTVVVTPMLALNALVMESSRIACIIKRMALAALSAEIGPGKRIAPDHRITKKLTHAVEEFINRLGKGALTSEVAEQIARLLRAEQHLLACAEQAVEIVRTQRDLKIIDDEQVMEYIFLYRAEVVRLLELANPEENDFSCTGCDSQMEKVQIAYDDVKAVLLHAGAELRIPIPDVIDVLEQHSHIRRMSQQMLKAMRKLNDVYTIVKVPAVETDTEVVSTG